MQTIIGLFGISGAGKTYTASTLAQKNSNVISVRASQIIAEYRDTISFQSLSHKVVDENQKILIEGFNKFKLVFSQKTIILELHNIIETPEGITYVDLEVFRELHIDKAIFLKLSPQALYSQRVNDKNRNRPHKTEQKLSDLQEKSLDYFCKIFEKLKLPYEIIEANHIDKLVSEL